MHFPDQQEQMMGEEAEAYPPYWAVVLTEGQVCPWKQIKVSQMKVQQMGVEEVKSAAAVCYCSCLP